MAYRSSYTVVNVGQFLSSWAESLGDSVMLRLQRTAIMSKPEIFKRNEKEKYTYFKNQ